jgi:hypothetical protein
MNEKKKDSAWIMWLICALFVIGELFIMRWTPTP